ncbi:EF-hand-containing protein [Dioscorea alata]|uniref:EF-hand-containing protein n=1 Tax=Dioscorea alata TaxID=55571 RepID=A0ACB7WCG8_DIOAL|nr:EF-hand-containing protein [Dioscorea alata]
MASSSSSSTRIEKVRRIFDRFDSNNDGGLDRSEMAELVVAVNPSVPFTPDQISSIVDEVFRSYSDFVSDPHAGLSLPGLLRTYDGAGDLDRDLAALNLSDFPNPNSSSTASPSSFPPWISPTNQGIIHESTRKTIHDLESLIKTRLIASNRSRNPRNPNEWSSESAWSADLSALYTPKSSNCKTFLKALNEIRAHVDLSPTTDEAFNGHMAIGRTLYDHKLFSESIHSFTRSSDLRPSDARPHFHKGNALWSLGRTSEARQSYSISLEAAEADALQWSSLLPQIHVNLGIAMESDGLLINAAEHYREAAILCPTHYRALKHLGSALFGAGDYRAAEKALEAAVSLSLNFADAHCDLGSVLHAMGDNDRAIAALQRAIDLNPDHLDALYNLGGLFIDAGRYQRAVEMYGRVISLRPDHWRAHLNRAAALLGAGEAEEAKKALNEAFKLTKRLELYDAISHFKNGGAEFIIVDAAKFLPGNGKTMSPEHLSDALRIRNVQKMTKLGTCSVMVWKDEIGKQSLHERKLRKSELEIILRKHLCFLQPECFQSAMKAVDEKVLVALDVTGSGKVDLGMFIAIVAPICAGPAEKRKRAAFDALRWRLTKYEYQGEIAKVDAAVYLRYMRAIYYPSQMLTDVLEGYEEEHEKMMISFHEFVDMFDDIDCGFGIMNALMKLEDAEKVYNKSKQCCSVCKYRITGLMFRETSSKFRLCSSCYSECKVPKAFQKEEYKFKECKIE